ncbi:hypothetical protein CLIB1444_01S17326 [[Candida] jaroonii]|uniref:Uncharacterized protein n=1 Tax=[Candida] jaroonii TaxID=467808 RepID=A0ACA9Y2S4_9ASCO|nr:hypothetical protein CLIB1444_01S17326 [[Candida] jaroonii]
MEGWNDCPVITRSSSSLVMGMSTSTPSLSTPSLTPTDSTDKSVGSIINELCSKPTKLSDKMLSNIKTKLENNIDKMEQHKQFIFHLYDSEEDVKEKIIEFMIINDGVSSWCVPLKKLIESIE